MTAQAQKVELWAIQPGPVDKSELVERAARTCYRSEMSETVEERMAFLEKLAKRGHLSVFEHARIQGRWGVEPFEGLWPFRYGVSITESAESHSSDREFIVSMNLRSAAEFESEMIDDRDNLLFSPDEWHDTIGYDELTPAERLAHASATFEIGGISRACSHQLVRHRVNSPSQESQRYVAAVDWEPVVPPSIAELDKERVFDWAMDKAKWAYKRLRIQGIPKEDARYVLPNATPTRIVVTATFEHWRLFLAQRMPIAAQWEIRKEAANEIARQLAEVEPELFGDLIEA